MAIDETTTDRTAKPKRKRSRPETLRQKMLRQIDRRTVSVCYVECVECGFIQNAEPGEDRESFALALARSGWQFNAELGAFVCCKQGDVARVADYL